MKKTLVFFWAIMATIRIASGSDFSFVGVALSDGRTLEQGIDVPVMTSSIQNIDAYFVVTVQWTGPAPSSGSGHHHIKARSVRSGEWLSRRACTPLRFSHEDANAAGQIVVRVPFHLEWRRIPTMTDGSLVPIEFSLNVSPSLHDDNASNNTRTFNLRLNNCPPPNDFVVEIVPNTLHTVRHNVPFNRRFDTLEFRVSLRFRNLAVNDAGQPAGPVPKVRYLIDLDYMRYDGQWTQLAFTIGKLVVRGDRWVTVEFKRDRSVRVWEGINAVPVNQWRPLRLQAYIDEVGGQVYYDTDRTNNMVETEFYLQ